MNLLTSILLTLFFVLTLTQPRKNSADMRNLNDLLLDSKKSNFSTNAGISSFILAIAYALTDITIQLLLTGLTFLAIKIIHDTLTPTFEINFKEIYNDIVYSSKGNEYEIALKVDEEISNNHLKTVCELFYVTPSAVIVDYKKLKIIPANEMRYALHLIEHELDIRLRTHTYHSILIYDFKGEEIKRIKTTKYNVNMILICLMRDFNVKISVDEIRRFSL